MQPITAKALFKDLRPAAPAGVLITSVVTDNRQVTPGCVFVAIQGTRVVGHDFARQACEDGAAFVVAQHTIADVPPDKTVLVSNALDAMITMGANYRSGFSPLLLGVTGSVGKTTTKEFCAAVFSAFGDTLKTEGNQNNEIGMPNTLFRLDEETRYAVVEMGMQGPGEIRQLTLAAKPDGAIITKIGRAHMDRLGSMEAILAAKMEICAGLPVGAPLILNGDDPLLRSVLLPEDIHAVYAAVDDSDCEVHAQDIQQHGEGQKFKIMDKQFGEYDAYIPALGSHIVADALLAYTAATRLGLNAQMAADALASFQPDGIRQHIRKVRGITLIEDYYNANPDSMKAALSLLSSMETEGRRIAVLGDMLELGELSEQAHHELGRRAVSLGVQLLVTVGKQAALAGTEASALGIQVRCFDQNAEATEFLQKELRAGDTALLKASRGMKFEEITEELELPN